MTPSRAIAPLDFLQLLAIALIWGVNNVAAKVALRGMPPFFAISVRFFVVFVLLGWFLKPIPQGKRVVFLLMTACMGGLHFALQYTGLKMATDLAPMVVAMQLWAPASVVIAMALLKEQVSGIRLAGVVIAFLGVAALAFEPTIFAQLDALLVVASAASVYGLGAVLVRKIDPSMDGWSMQAWIALVAAPSMFVCSVLFEGNPLANARSASLLSWGCVMYSALMASIAVNAMLFRLVRTYEVSRTTPYLLLAPVVSFFLSWQLLDDPITWRLILGAALTMVGVLLVALAERRFKALA